MDGFSVGDEIMITASEFGDTYYEIVKIADLDIFNYLIILENPLSLWHYGSSRDL